MIKITYQRLFEAVDALQKTRVKGGEKFNYAVNKTGSKIASAYKKFNKKCREIEIELCETDKNKVIVRDQYGHLQFTKANSILKDKKIEELEAQEIEVEPYYATLTLDIARQMGPHVLEIISGVFVREGEVKSFVEALEKELEETIEETKE